jgi:hypothetical protein
MNANFFIHENSRSLAVKKPKLYFAAPAGLRLLRVVTNACLIPLGKLFLNLFGCEGNKLPFSTVGCKYSRKKSTNLGNNDWRIKEWQIGIP